MNRNSLGKRRGCGGCVCRFVDVAFARKMLPDLSESQTIDFRATVKNTQKWEYIFFKKNTETITENAPSVVNYSLFSNII
jgi:hypothetical protein